MKQTEKNIAGLNAPVLGELRMDKTMKKIVILIFGVCVLLLQACDGNKFLQDALEKLNPPSPAPSKDIAWDDNVVYINPKDKIIDATMGVISGLFSNNGSSIWPRSDITGNGPSSARQMWRVDSADEENYPAGTITTILSANSSPTTAVATGGTLGNVITLIFTTGTAVGDDITDATYSFILTPNAFYGPDSAALTEDMPFEFKLVMPTSTVYGQKWVEKNMYVPIRTTWAAGSAAAGAATGSTATIEEVVDWMIADAGSRAAAAAEARLTGYKSPFNFDDPSGSMSVLSWEPTPDLSKGWARLKNYKLVLTPIYDPDDGDETFVPVAISAPVEFMSNVGSVAVAIEAAVKAGSFGQDPGGSPPPSADPTTGYPAYIQHGGTADVSGILSAGTAAWHMINALGLQSLIGKDQVMGGSKLENETSQQELTLLLGQGTDGSPIDSLTFKVWVKSSP
jgi:hypothetical protein